MRYWPRAPRPGSLEEDIAIAVELWEEDRIFQYVQLVAFAPGLAAAGKGEVIDKLVGQIQARFFEREPPKVSTKDRDEFLRLAETHAFQVDPRALVEAVMPGMAPVESRQVFNIPKGRGFDDQIRRHRKAK